VNGVPVTDERERKQHERDQEQPGGLLGIDRMAMVVLGVVVVASGLGHAVIVAPDGATLRLAHGCAAKPQQNRALRRL